MTQYEEDATYAVMNDALFPPPPGDAPCRGCGALRATGPRLADVGSSLNAHLSIRLNGWGDLARDHMYQRHPDEYAGYRRRFEEGRAARLSDDRAARESDTDNPAVSDGAPDTARGEAL